MITYFLIVTSALGIDVSDRFLQSTRVYFEENFGPGGLAYWKDFDFSSIPNDPVLAREMNSVAQSFQLKTDWMIHSKKTNQLRFRVHRLFGVFDFIRTKGYNKQYIDDHSFMYHSSYSYADKSFVNMEMITLKKALFKVNLIVYPKQVNQILRAIGMTASWTPKARPPPQMLFSEFMKNINFILSKLHGGIHDDCHIYFSCDNIWRSLKSSLDRAVLDNSFDGIQQNVLRTVRGLTSILASEDTDTP